MICALAENGIDHGCAELDRQKIVVFQQSDRARTKIEGIKRYGGGRFILEVISIEESLPSLIDDGEEYLPSHISASLVLDYLKHPDLSEDLARLCARLKIPVVASGKKHRFDMAFTPPICCALPRQSCLGYYGERFGAPEMLVKTDKSRILSVEVLRGSPCGATWDAVERIRGLPIDEALVRIGLETQFFCSADPSGWDPLYGKSPVHFAGHIHKAALEKAIDRGGR